MLSADPSIFSTRQERTRRFQDALELVNKEYVTKIVKEDVTYEEFSEVLSHELKLSSLTLVFVANFWLSKSLYGAKRLLQFDS